MSSDAASPHGSILVDRLLSVEQAERASRRAESLPSIELTERQARDAENIATGVYSPLAGFMGKADVESVLERGRLASGIAWTIPIVLDVSAEDARRAARGEEVALRFEGRPLAILRVSESFALEVDRYVLGVFGAADATHPGVAAARTMRPVMLAGEIDCLALARTPFPRHRLAPREARALFERNGWRTVVGFQTRNIPHIGHEALQKAALNVVDGLFVHPLVGGKKAGDFEDAAIVAAYDALLQHYYPADRAALGVLQGEMRYAGPKEAIFHAIQRKNFGCTHFIVGRDHAGVGSFYPPYAAQEIFEAYPDLGITPLFFGAFFRCNRCGGLVNEKGCPHGPADRVHFSGTRLREAIRQAEDLDSMIRPEVAAAVRAVDGVRLRG